MNLRIALAQIIERVFPERVARIRETNRQRRHAMQLMLDVNRDLRMNKNDVEEINRKMRPMLNRYKRGKYDGMADFIPSIY